MTIKSPKKLIEVALPLDDINAAAAREKSIRHGHPSTCISGGHGDRWRRRGR
jgi:adenine-specific DNA methylase